MSMKAWGSNAGWTSLTSYDAEFYMKMGEWIYRLKIAAEVEDYEEMFCVAKEMEKFCKEGQ
jgi:hypothetical protein